MQQKLIHFYLLNQDRHHVHLFCHFLVVLHNLLPHDLMYLYGQDYEVVIQQHQDFYPYLRYVLDRT